MDVLSWRQTAFMKTMDEIVMDDWCHGHIILDTISIYEDIY